jgi:hypothetical protein
MYAILLTTLAAATPRSASSTHARAVVRIVRTTAATREAWEAQSQGQRHEIRKRDHDGRLIVLRLIEQE